MSDKVSSEERKEKRKRQESPTLLASGIQGTWKHGTASALSLYPFFDLDRPFCKAKASPEGFPKRLNRLNKTHPIVPATIVFMKTKAVIQPFSWNMKPLIKARIEGIRVKLREIMGF
jgi:hypothetical protein